MLKEKGIEPMSLQALLQIWEETAPDTFTVKNLKVGIFYDFLCFSN
jgi:hypothetical protein